MSPTSRLFTVLLLTMAPLTAAQTVTVTTSADVVDIDWQSATVADLPGPDGKVSFSEAMIATNNTPGHQTVGFAIPPAEWTLQFALPGRAVLQSVTGYYFRANDTVTIDGTTQTAFSGDTNPDGCEVAIYGLTLYLNADACTLIGFDSTAVQVGGSNSLVQGNTGSMNITVFGGSGSLIEGNEGGTIKIDRSSNNVVVGNMVDRVRVLGGGPVAAGNRIGGPEPADRNIIRGYGSYNSEGLPSGSAVQIAFTQGTIVQNNWIGTPDGLTIGNLACTIGVVIESQNDDVLIQDNLISGIYGLGIGPHYAGTLWGRGILASGTGNGLVISGNTIGPDITGAPELGAVWGVDLGDPVTHPLGMSAITVSGNEIAGHIFNGVTVGRNTAAVRLSANAIHDNGWLGIDLIPSGYGYGVSPNDPLDLDTGGNGVQNFPVLESVTRQGGAVRLVGSLHSSPSSAFTVEFFASPACDDSGHGEGQVFLGSAAVSTDGAGDAAFDVTLATTVEAGHVVTATATREPGGTTSEFSACLQAVWDDLGGAAPDADSEPDLTLAGPLSAGSELHLALREAPPSSLAVVFIAFSSSPAPFLGGTLHAFPVGELVVTGTDPAGVLTGSATFPGAPSGTSLWFQVGVADPAVPVYGACLSNGIRGTVP